MTLIIEPTSELPIRTGGTYLTIGIRTPDGCTPVSMFRGQNVGVGGKYTTCPIAQGEPVRRATLGELRLKDRLTIARYLAIYPDGVVVARRSRH
jgi:hypothetical protein